MAKYNTKAEAEQQLQHIKKFFPKSVARLSAQKDPKYGKYARDEIFYLLTARGVDNNMAMIVADNWARESVIESTLHGLDNLIEGVNFDSLKRNPTRNGVHILELKHVFFNKSQFAPHGKDQFIKWLIEQRGYSDAEAIVSMEEVYDRGQNVLNKAKGESKEPITGWTDDEEEEGEAGVKKKEYDWTVDPDLFDEEEESKSDETHYKYQRRHYIEIGNKLKNLSKDQKQQEFKKWDEIFRADNERYDSQRFADHIGLFEGIKETLESLDNLIESAAWIKGTIGSNSLHKRDEATWQDVQKMAKRDGVTVTRADFDEYFNETAYEVLQSASGSLSPQRRNKAIRALQSIPRGQSLGQSDVIPNIDTALEALDNLIEAKELKQQIGEALVQIKEALRPMPDAGRSGYNKFGHQGFRKEWSELLRVYEDLLNKCQAKTGMGRTIGTRPATINTEREFKERLKFLESELRKCQQGM